MAIAMAEAESHIGSTRGPLLAQLIEAAAAAYDPETARHAGGRARFDYLACRAAGRRSAPADFLLREGAADHRSVMNGRCVDTRVGW